MDYYSLTLALLALDGVLGVALTIFLVARQKPVQPRRRSVPVAAAVVSRLRGLPACNRARCP